MTVKEMEVEDPPESSKERASALRNSMLDHLSENEEAHFKSQQLNEPDLTTLEKRKIAEDILDRNPGCFLSRFGKFLLNNHLDYFTDMSSDNYEVNYYINDLKKHFQKPSSKSIVRNRRFEALRRLTLNGEYFSDEEMRKRNPSMYEHLVGQYLTEEEKAGLQYERLQAGSISSIILNAVDENEIKEKLEEDELEGEIEGGGESDSDSGMSAVSGVSMKDTFKPWGEFTSPKDTIPQPTLKQLKKRKKKKKYPEPPTEEERTMMMNEFRSRMFEEFLGGRDAEFDYTAVDSNNDYDDLEMLEYDQQDKYFDSELPEEAMSSRGDDSPDSASLPPSPRSLEERMAHLET